MSGRMGNKSKDEIKGQRKEEISRKDEMKENREEKEKEKWKERRKEKEGTWVKGRKAEMTEGMTKKKEAN